MISVVYNIDWHAGAGAINNNHKRQLIPNERAAVPILREFAPNRSRRAPAQARFDPIAESSVRSRSSCIAADPLWPVSNARFAHG